MIRFILLLVLIFSVCWCYQNYDSLKETTMQNLKNEKTIKKFNNSEKIKLDALDEAVKY